VCQTSDAAEQETAPVSVTISRVLETKGHDVITTTPNATVLDAVKTLQQHHIGALAVVEDGQPEHVVGIISERDVVQRVAMDGPVILDHPVGEIMTADPVTCPSDATISQLMAIMTERRIRHLPVVDDGRLVGMVSIGDIVKRQLDDLQLTAEQLTHYVSGSY
jgi:CBS domain-containing protein